MTTLPVQPTSADHALQRPSLPDVVHDELRRRILNNEFAAGERLIETTIAEEYQVSRTTLREALRRLANEKLIEISARRGCFVARMRADEVHDSCFARYILEAAVATDDLTWITEETLERLSTLVDTMAEFAVAGDMASIVDTDTAFHSLIVSGTRGQRVRELWHLLDGQMGSLMRSSFEHQGIDMQEIVDRHVAVIDALRTRDGSVIHQALREHYLTPDMTSTLPDAQPNNIYPL